MNSRKRRYVVAVFAVVAVSLSLVSCGRSHTPLKPLPTGEGRLAVEGGNIWYYVTGNGTGTPVVLLHGGPGFNSFYLKPFEDLGNDRQVIRYDQLGAGKSDRVTDTMLFTIDHFVRELDSLRSHLGVEVWHVNGHSWGTILALEYYRQYPRRVVSLVLGSSAIDIPAWERNAKRLVTTLSPAAQEAIRKAEGAQTYDDPAYQRALEEFYNLYVWRTPVQADLESTLTMFSGVIYSYMWGPSEFTITGTLRSYDATTFLPNVSVPTLFTVGEFDEANPEIVRAHAAMVPYARVEVLKGASHVTPWDARDENVRVVREFLREVDGKR